MSYRSLNIKPLNASLKTLLKRTGHIGLGLSAFTPVLALANPTGGQVVAGTATISNPNANGTVITQTSAAAIINWQQFNIGQGQYVQFLQPSSSSIILNRVIGGGSSSIYGNLTGNGQIFLVNTNGVFFGKGASIDAQGFLASTLDINDNDFLSGHYVFQKGSGAADAQVVNQGSITAHSGGYVVLAGDYAENDGVIAAKSGHVVLASGTKATLGLSGNSLVSFAVNQATLAQYAGVTNTGSLIADGGTVVMTADVANALKATVVNNSGLVEAHGLLKTSGGIYLTATGGNIENSGTLDANAADPATAGGAVVLHATSGDAFLEATSQIDTVGMGGAKGGSVELSGDNVAIRGLVNIGDRGNFKIDPTSFEFKAGGGAAGSNSVGTGYIASHGNVNFTFSAANKIFASSAAKAHGLVNPGTGNLKLKIGAGGLIDLSGFNITIGGALTTSIVGTISSGAQWAREKFGFIKAKSVDLYAGSSDITVHGASGAGSALKKSIVATGGDIIINASNGYKLDTSSGSKGLQLSAAGNIDLEARITGYAGDVNIKATDDVELNRVNATGNITISAQRIGHTGSFGSVELQAGKNLTVAGQFGSGTSGALATTLKLEAGSANTIKLNKSIAADGTVSFNGGRLAYTGTGPFSVTAHNGAILDYAAIGSANAKAHYAVTFDASGSAAGNAVVQKSIYTTKAISITGKDVDIGGSNSAALTLYADDANAATTTDNITLTATGTGASDIVRIHPATASISNASGTVDHSVTVHAGQDVVITGKNVALQMGTARAVIDSSGKTIGAATAKANLTVSAGHDVSITAGSNVLIGAFRPSSTNGFGLQSDLAHVALDTKAAATATALSNVSVTGGHDISVTAGVNNVWVGGGNDRVFSVTAAKGQSIAAKASGTVALTAGHNLGLVAGNYLTAQAGSGWGSSSKRDYVLAGDSSANAVGTTATDLTLKAGSTVTIVGHNNVNLHAGYNVAGASDRSCGTGCNQQYGAYVTAFDPKAGASLTATSGLAVNAGAGGIQIEAKSSGNIDFIGGNSAARGITASDHANGDKVKVDVEAKASLVTTGAVSLIGHGIRVAGGGGVLGTASSYYSSATHNIHATIAGAGSKDTVSVTGNTGVSVTANKGITMTASGGYLNVYGGYSAARQLQVEKLGHSGSFAVNVDQTAKLAAASGGITLTNPGGHMFLAAGGHDAMSAGVIASYGGQALLNTKSGISITAGGAFKASAAGYVELGAGSDYNAAYTNVSADKSATAKLTTDTSATLKAASVTFNGSAAYIGAGGNASHSASNARSAGVSGKSGGKASLTENNDLTITTPGAFTVTANTGQLNIFAASVDNLYSASASANAGGQANLVANGAINIAAGGAVTLKATAGNMAITAGSKDASSAVAFASNSAKANIAGNTGVSIIAGGNFTASAGGNLFIGGGGSAAENASAKAYHGPATAAITANANVTISGNHVTLTAKGHNLSIAGGTGAASSAYAQGTDHGVATIAGTGTVAINAKSAFKASLAGSGVGGNLKVYVGGGAADNASANGSVSGKAVIAGDDSVKIAVSGGPLTLTTGVRTSSASGTNNKHLNLDVQASYAASGANATGSHGIASISGKGNVSLSAAGGVTIDTKNGGLTIFTSTYNAGGAKASANGIGATATITAQDAVSIGAGGAVAISAGRDASIYAGDSHMENAGASANSAGIATINAKSNVSIVAGGTFTAKAGGSLALYGGSQNGMSDTVKAYNGATATMADDATMAIKATAITLSAGNSLDVYGGYDDVGYNADIRASNAAVARLTAKSGVSLNATAGAFLAKAGGNLSFYAGRDSVGSGGSIYGEHHGQAALTADTSIKVNAATSITMEASGSLFLRAAKYAVAEGDYDFASDYGVAKVNASGVLNMTAGTAFTAKLLGTGTGHSLQVGGGSYAGYSATASAQRHGVATINAANNVNIDVTGSAGTITITTGTQTKGSLSIYAADSNGRNANANASHGGVAALNINSGVTLKTKGDIAIKATGASTNLSIYGGYDNNGRGASASASGQSVSATLNVAAGVNISGHNVAISAGTYMKLYAGSDYNAYGAYAKGINHGVAKLNVDTSLNISAAGNFTAKASGMSIYGGDYENLYSASASANHGGVATITANDAVHITAGGTVSLKATTGSVSIFGGYESDAEYTVVKADNFGNAAIKGDQSVNIKAGGAFTASAVKNMNVYGGEYYLGESATVDANHSATASLTDNGSVNITGSSLKLTTTGSTGNLEVYGGTSYAAYNATMLGGSSGNANLNVKANVNLAATSGDVIMTAGNNLKVFGGSDGGYSDSLVAEHHGHATLTADTSVNITGNHVNFTAGGSELYIFGGSYTGYNPYLYASDGGVANLSAKGGVKINAKSGFSANLNLAAGASRNGYIYVYGGSYAGYSGSEYAYSHATANVNADATVAINAGTGNLTLNVSGAKLIGGDLYVYGGSEAGYNAYFSATDAGVAKMTAKAGVSLTAAGNVSATQPKGYLAVYGGSAAAEDASMYAYGGAVTTLNADASVAVTAGKAITLTGGSNMSIYGGDYAGYGATASAHSAGIAKINGSGKATFTAGTSFHAHATDYMEVYGGSENGYSAYAGATNTGAVASISADGSLTIKAGTTVGIKGSSGGSIYAYTSNGKYAQASANSHGVAAVNATNHVSITGGGAVTLSGGTKNFSIYNSDYNGSGASANAYHGGVATLNAIGGVAIKGTSVTMTAGTNLKIYGGYENISGGAANATDGGIAKMTGNANVSITATAGAVTAKAGGSLSIYADDYNGYSAYLDASGAGAKVSMTGNTSVNLQGTTVALSAGKNLVISGGYYTGESASVYAYKGGVAAMNVTSQVNITGATAVSAKLTGAGTGDKLSIYGYSGVGYGMFASATGAGIAAATATGGVNMKATAAGGTVTISTGTQTNASLSIYADKETGYSASAQAKTGGVATVNATNAVNISAPGAITINGPHAGLSIYASDNAGSGASAKAVGPGAKAAVNVVQSVNIKGGSVAVTAGGYVEIYGGYADNGDSATAIASSGGAAKINVNATTNITAAGNLNVTGSGMSIYGGYSYVGYNASASAKHNATAAMSVDASANLTAGGAITLKATTGSMSIYGGYYAGYDAGAFASDHATAAMSAKGGVNIKAGGAFTATAKHDLSIYNDYDVGYNAYATASGAAAKATVLAQNNVNITAAGAVTLKSGTAASDTLEIVASNSAARIANAKAGTTDTAVLTADSQINIKAGGAIIAGAGGKMLISGGNDLASAASVVTTGGTAAVNANANVSLTAGGSISMTLVSGVASFLAGTGGFAAHVSATGGVGSAVLNTNASVSLFAGTGLKVAGATAITETAGNFPVASHQVVIAASSGGVAKANVTQNVTLSGTSITLNKTPTKTNGANAVNSGGITDSGKVSNTTHAALSFAPLYFSPLLTATMTRGIHLLSSGAATPLSTLMGDGIVVNLLPVLEHPQLQQSVLTGTDFTSGAATSSQMGGAECSVTLVQDHGSFCRTR